MSTRTSTAQRTLIPFAKLGMVGIAILVLISPLTTTANASELGRLFHTPQERAQLEAGTAVGNSKDGARRDSIVVNGVIQKQGGSRIVWLNGEAQTPVKANDNPASIDVAVPGKTKHVQVKVGQRLMLEAAPNGTSENSAKSTPDDD